MRFSQASAPHRNPVYHPGQSTYPNSSPPANILAYEAPPPRNISSSNYSEPNGVRLPPPRPYHGPHDPANNFLPRLSSHPAPVDDFRNNGGTNRFESPSNSKTIPPSGYPPPSMSSAFNASVTAQPSTLQRPSHAPSSIYQSPTSQSTTNQLLSAPRGREQAPATNPFRRPSDIPCRPAAPPSSLARTHSPSAPHRPQNIPTAVIINSHAPHGQPQRPAAPPSAVSRSQPQSTSVQAQQAPASSGVSIKDMVRQFSSQQQQSKSEIPPQSLCVPKSTTFSPPREAEKPTSPRGQLLGPRGNQNGSLPTNSRVLPPRPAIPPSHARQRSKSDNPTSVPPFAVTRPSTPPGQARSKATMVSNEVSSAVKAPRKGSFIPEKPTEAPPPRPSSAPYKSIHSASVQNDSSSPPNQNDAASMPKVVITEDNVPSAQPQSTPQLDVNQRRGSAPSPVTPHDDYTSSYSAISPREKHDPLPLHKQLVGADAKVSGRLRTLSVGDAPPPIALTHNAKQCIVLVGMFICFFFVAFHPLENKFVEDMLDILDPSDGSMWKKGLSREGLVSFSRKVPNYHPIAYRVETTINCEVEDLYTITSDPFVRSRVRAPLVITRLSYFSGI